MATKIYDYENGYWYYPSYTDEQTGKTSYVNENTGEYEVSNVGTQTNEHSGQQEYWDAATRQWVPYAGGRPPETSEPTLIDLQDIKNRTPFSRDPYYGILVADPNGNSPTDPNEYYRQLGSELAKDSFNLSGFNQDSSQYDTLIEGLKDISPQGYYTAKISALSRAAGNNYINNEMGRMDTINNQIKALLPEAQKAGVTPEQINSIYGSGSSYGAQAGRQYLSNLQSQKGGFFAPLIEGLKVIGPALAIPLTAGASTALSGAMTAAGVSASVAGVAAPAMIAAATSAGFAALSGQDVGKAALTGAIGGGVGAGINTFGIDAAANLVGGGDAIMGMAKLSEAANNLGMTTSQVSSLLSSAISTELSGIATGANQDQLLQKITNNLASTAISNYAGNLTASILPSDLTRAANSVAAITKIGVNAALNGQDIQTALVNNVGQIIGAAAQTTKYTDISKLFNNDGSISTSGLDEINKETEKVDSSVSDDNFKVMTEAGYNPDGIDNSGFTKEELAAIAEGEKLAEVAQGTGTQTASTNNIGYVTVNQVEDDETKEPVKVSYPEGTKVNEDGSITVKNADGSEDNYDKDGNLVNTKEAEQDPSQKVLEVYDYGEGMTVSRMGDGRFVVSDKITGTPLGEINNPAPTGSEPVGSTPVGSVTNPDSSVTTYYDDGSSKVTVPSNTTGGDATNVTTVGNNVSGTGDGTGALDTIGTGALDTIGTSGDGTGALDTIGAGGDGTGGDGTGGDGTGGDGTVTDKTEEEEKTTTGGGGGGGGGTTPVTPIKPVIPKTTTGGLSTLARPAIKDLTPQLTKSTAFKFANQPSYEYTQTPMTTQNPFDYTSQIFNAATGGTTSNAKTIADLKPQLTERRSFEFAQNPAYNLQTPSAPQASQPFDYTQQILNAAQGGLIQGYAMGDQVGKVEGVEVLSPQTVRGRRFPGFFQGPQMAQSYAPRQYAQGGDVEGHNPQFFSEGGLNSLDNTYVKGEGDGTSDSVPAMLANGEFVIPADVVSKLGNGSNDAGADVLGEFLSTIRSHAQNHDPKKLPPESKGALAYLLDAKRKAG